MSENNKATFDCDLPSIDGPISHREALALYAQENVALRAEIAALREQLDTMTQQAMTSGGKYAAATLEIAALREQLKDAHAQIEGLENELIEVREMSDE